MRWAGARIVARWECAAPPSISGTQRVGRVARLDIYPVKKPRDCTVNGHVWSSSANGIITSQFPSVSLSSWTCSLRPPLPAERMGTDNMRLLSWLPLHKHMQVNGFISTCGKTQLLFLFLSLFETPPCHGAELSSKQIARLLRESVSGRFMDRQIWSDA